MYGRARRVCYDARMRRAAPLFLLLATASLTAQGPAQPDWARAEDETMRHFQALLRFDTSDPPATPPGGEKPAADYLKQVLDQEGIPAEVFALEANRPNSSRASKATAASVRCC